MESRASTRSGTGAGRSVLSIALEGFNAGVIGAAAVAIWFLVIDSLAGQPFYTPAALGAGLFEGRTAADLQGMPESAATLVLAYTVFHGLAFVIAGLIIAAVVSIFDRTPAAMIPGAFFLVVFFEFAYYMYVLAFVEPVLGAVSWPEILVGNLAAVVSMAGFFWRRHPDLLKRLARV